MFINVKHVVVNVDQLDHRRIHGPGIGVLEPNLSSPGNNLAFYMIVGEFWRILAYFMVMVFHNTPKVQKVCISSAPCSTHCYNVKQLNECWLLITNLYWWGHSVTFEVEMAFQLLNHFCFTCTCQAFKDEWRRRRLATSDNMWTRATALDVCNMSEKQLINGCVVAVCCNL